MIIWLLMILDIMTLTSISLAHFLGLYAWQMLFLSGAYLVLKGFLFRDVMSIMDAGIGVYIWLMLIFHFTTFFYYFIMAWFAYKLFFTFFS